MRDKLTFAGGVELHRHKLCRQQATPTKDFLYDIRIPERVVVGGAMKANMRRRYLYYSECMVERGRLEHRSIGIELRSNLRVKTSHPPYRARRKQLVPPQPAATRLCQSIREYHQICPN